MLQCKNILCIWSLFIGYNHEATNHVEFLLADYFTERDLRKDKKQKCWNSEVQCKIREATTAIKKDKNISSTESVMSEHILSD